MIRRIRIGSIRKPGRLVPSTARALRARAVQLPPAGIMAWHSTLTREELLIGCQGRLDVEIRRAGQRVRQVRLSAGRTTFLPSHTWHRVVNRSAMSARYIYVTASIS